jgi:L-fuculose-phosphate aldolase
MVQVQAQSKEHFRDRSIADMEKHFNMPDWSVHQKLALACRIMAIEGHGSGMSGQISTRGPRAGTSGNSYWMLGFGLGFDEACARNIVQCDDDLNLLQGNGMVNPANRFHVWIYRHRPDVKCIVHTHAPYVSALSMIGEPLAVSHMDTTMFYEDCAYLRNWPGVPIGDEEGKIIHEALGGKRAMLLAHHGLLTASGTIEEAAVLAVFLERAAKLQLLARAAGEIRPISPELGREAHDWRLKPMMIAGQFHYFARRALQQLGDDCLR